MTRLNIPEFNADVNMDIDNNSLGFRGIDTFSDWYDVLQDRNMLDAILRAVSRSCLTAHGCQCEDRTDCPAYPEHCHGWINLARTQR